MATAGKRRLTPFPRMPSTPFDALSGIPNACEPLPGLVTGGQPTEAQLEAFRAAREPRPLDEVAVNQRLGLEYLVIPVGAANLSDATLERILDALRMARGRATLFHCASGNRVGAALIPYLVLDQAMGEEDAVRQAIRVGLTSPELLAWGLDYARRQRNA